MTKKLLSIRGQQFIVIKGKILKLIVLKNPQLLNEKSRE